MPKFVARKPEKEVISMRISVDLLHIVDEKAAAVAIARKGRMPAAGVENTRFEPLDFDREAGAFRSPKGEGLQGYGQGPPRRCLQT